MSFTLKQLRYFVAVANAGSVIGAAQSLSISQSAVTEALKAGREGDVLESYATELKQGPVGKDLKRVRNVKPMWSKFGLAASLALGGFDIPGVFTPAYVPERSLQGGTGRRTGPWRGRERSN